MEPILAIKCLVYNHGKYIRQCLDGIVNQKTQYPFIAIVHDDASTDNSAEIICEYEAKYPHIIKAIYETENQYSKPDCPIDKIVYGKVPLSVKYLAWCEGDDYWTDIFKLQKQIDFLEKNPAYGLCYGKIRSFHQISGKLSPVIKSKKMKTFSDIFFIGNGIPTLTSVIRKDICFKYREELNPDSRSWLMGDLPLWLYTAHSYKIKKMNDVFGVYRVLTESASHSSDPAKMEKFRESGCNIRYDLACFFHEEKKWAQYQKCIEFDNACFAGDYQKCKKLFISLCNSGKTRRRFSFFICSFFPKLFIKLQEHFYNV